MKQLFLSVLALSFAISAQASSQYFVVQTQDQGALPTSDIAHVSPLGGQASKVEFLTEQAAAMWIASWRSMNIKVEAEMPLVFERDSRETTIVPEQQAAAVGELNDPLLSSQVDWDVALNAVRKGVVEQRGLSTSRVAVLDVGYLPHEDLRPVSGYSFTTYNNAIASDNYQAISTNGGKTCQSAHGNNMMGVIGATRNNGKGIAGISTSSLYVGRVLSTDCVAQQDVGFLSDVANGIYWAIGRYNAHKIPKVDFVNISVASKSHCPAYLQDAINEANAAGTIVVVSAGNYGELAMNYAPANCQGVVVVGAHTNTGQLTSYSNYGDAVSLTVAGTRFTTGDVGYETIQGTSGAAAAVTGMLAALKQSFPDKSNASIWALLKGSVTKNVDSCQFDCGVGYANFSSAVLRGEKLFDPVLTMKHAFGSGEDCKQERQVDALIPYVDSCKAYTVNVATRYAEDKIRPTQYKVNLIRRDAGVVGWEPGRFNIVSSVTPTVNNDAFPWLNVDDSKYDYGLVACDGDFCPFPVDIDVSAIPKPDSCQ